MVCGGGWGGQSDLPELEPATSFVQVSAGDDQKVLLRNDGRRKLQCCASPISSESQPRALMPRREQRLHDVGGDFRALPSDTTIGPQWTLAKPAPWLGGVARWKDRPALKVRTWTNSGATGADVCEEFGLATGRRGRLGTRKSGCLAEGGVGGTSLRPIAESGHAKCRKPPLKASGRSPSDDPPRRPARDPGMCLVVGQQLRRRR